MIVKFMSWGHTVQSFKRQPPSATYHPAVWNELQDDIVHCLIDEDITWFSMWCGWGLIRELPNRIFEARLWSRQ